MKKILKLLLIMTIPIIISSCGSKDYKEGQLVEISGIELTENFSGEKIKNFIFAIVNERKPGYKSFLIDLEKYAKETNKAIYFTYYNHIDTDASFYIFSLYEADFTTNGYHVIEDGKLTVTKEYTNYQTMKKDLEEKRFYTTLDYTSEEDVKKNLKLAQEEYDKGNMSISFNYINKIWNRKEAKEFYANHPKLKLINFWENSIITKDKRDRITYRSILFIHNANYFLEIEVKEYNDTFEKPNNMSDYDLIYYYMKDDIIYTSDKEDGTYKKRFKITELENENMTVYDYKYDKEYEYTRKV